MYVTGSYRLTPQHTECKHVLKDSAFKTLQDSICLQNSLGGGGGGEQTHSQPSVYNYRLFLFDLILYVPSTIFQLNRDGSSWVKPALS